MALKYKGQQMINYTRFPVAFWS